MKLRQLAILGPGLLGGSLLMAAKQRQLADSYSVWARSSEAIAQIESLQLADIASNDLSTVVADAELVVICTPVKCIPPLARQFLPMLSNDATVTDVGSTKQIICQQLDEVFAASNATFIGSHPMAGSEQSGLQAAYPDLYQGAVTIVTPTSHSDQQAVELVSRFWRSLDSSVLELPPATHDSIVAAISHLPHLCAGLLVQLAADTHPQAMACIGNGFLDTTRVASGSPDLWTQIIADNKEPILESLARLDDSIAHLRNLIQTDDWHVIEDFLGKAKSTRDKFAA